MLDHEQARAGDVADARSSTGPSASVSRCAMPDDGSSSRITFGLDTDLAGEVDDAPAPGGEVRHELVAEVAEPHDLDQLVGPLGEPAFGRRDVRAACSAASTGSQTLSWRSSATHSVWWTVSAPKSRASWNDRARPEPRALPAGSDR